MDPPFCTLLLESRHARRTRSCSLARTAPSTYSSQLNRGSSRRAAWRGAEHPGRLSRRQARPASRTRQRRQLPANRAEPLITAGEATARQRASMLTRCRISAYPGIFSALMLETLSFVRVAILEDLADATGRRARSRRVPVPWQACHEQAQRRSKQSQAWPCRGAVAGGLTGRASMAFNDLPESKLLYRSVRPTYEGRAPGFFGQEIFFKIDSGSA